MFREASPALFTATEKRAYFKKVTILIPVTWTNTTIDRLANSEVYEVCITTGGCSGPFWWIKFWRRRPNLPPIFRFLHGFRPLYFEFAEF